MEIKEKSKKIISAKNIYKSFKTGGRYTKVLKGISLDIMKGEFLVVFGPSGCGKSTLLHIITGLEKPDKGSVQVEGMDMWSMSLEDRAILRKREIGIMFQQQNWIRSLSVEENIAFSGQLIGLEKEEALDRAREVLAIVGMNIRSKYIPSELSAGEQQKIGLARALMIDPKILISDEPTGDLDVESGQEMMDIFEKLNKSGKTIIMVTHNPEYLKFADRILLMLNGRIRREIKVTEESAESVEKEISADLKKFIEQGTKLEEEIKDTSLPAERIENLDKRNVFQKIIYAIVFNIRFLFQSFLFLFLLFLKFLGKKSPFFNKQAEKFKSKLADLCRKMDRNKSGKISSSINTLDLTEISFRNLLVKKSRTFVTIIGVAIGIGFIVFLLSLGYGLERLVISEITRIQDLKQVDIMPNSSSTVKLDSDSVEIISQIGGVRKVMPLINLAGRAEYEESITDVVVYGVEGQYIEDSSITLSAGNIFSDKEAGVVVNEEFLSLVEVSPKDAIGKELLINFVLYENTGDFSLEEGQEDVKEEEIDEIQENKRAYSIIGVVDDSNPSIIYVPLKELDAFGIEEYSQLRIVVDKDEQIQNVRRQIEVLGFGTSSVMDTISEVESLFKYAKIGLFSIGVIVLSIAVLGMFNTLTVSLLERTREVGLMKTLGMKTDEIRSLFINESMLMGLAGGTLGVIFGLLLGLALSFILSIFSLSRQGQYITVSFLPIYLVVGIVVISTFVGFVTGLYPSKRAAKMAPLDALRYE